MTKNAVSGLLSVSDQFFDTWNEHGYALEKNHETMKLFFIEHALPASQICSRREVNSHSSKEVMQFDSLDETRARRDRAVSVG